MSNGSHRWASPKPWKARALVHVTPGDKGKRKALEGGGILPTSVVAWGPWISPSRQHLRGVSQAANHIRSWLPAGPRCPTPLQEPAFQDWLHTLHRYRPLPTESRHKRLEALPTQGLATRGLTVLPQSQETYLRSTWAVMPRTFFPLLRPRSVPPGSTSYSGLPGLASVSSQIPHSLNPLSHTLLTSPSPPNCFYSPSLAHFIYASRET